MAISAKKIEIKLEEVDPTGVVVSTQTLDHYIFENTMRDSRFILKFGDHIYAFTKDGDLIKQLK